jgi:hypothetical protein
LRSPAFVAFALLLSGPAWAQGSAYTADDFLTAAGLSPRSTVPDAEKIYGGGWRKMGSDGIEYLAAGSLADAWMTFRPGSFVYVDCGITPATLPDDVVSQLCKVARQTDWRLALVQLKQMLRNGQPAGGVQARLSADRPDLDLAATKKGSRDGEDDDDEDDKAFVQLARTFTGRQYKVTVEVAPMITTEAGTSRAAVIVRWERS